MPIATSHTTGAHRAGLQLSDARIRAGHHPCPRHSCEHLTPADTIAESVYAIVVLLLATLVLQCTVALVSCGTYFVV
jgi:hypothetical protein